MIELFKPIEDFEDYEISNYGRVYSHITNKILKIHYDKDGYYHITLYKDKKNNNKSIHRLVAEAFLPNPLGLPCVNHKDENKQNNFVWINDDGSVDYEKSNLEWCTVKYNNNYNGRQEKIAAKRRGVFKHSEDTKRKMSEMLKGKPKPKKRKPVVAVKDGVVIMEFSSIQEAVSNGYIHVSDCCYGKRKTCGGYEWYFKDEWLQMQKENAAPHKRETAYQLEIQFD